LPVALSRRLTGSCLPPCSSRHDGEQEKEALVNLVQLTPQGLAEATKEALRLNEHARRTATAVFDGSAPAKRTR